MNNIPQYQPNPRPPYMPRKKRHITKIMGGIVGVIALAFGAGYAGASFAVGNVAAIEADALYTDILQTYSAEAITQAADGVFQIVNESFASQELSLPDLFDGANPAVVAISTEVIGRNAFGHSVSRPASGSGFLVSPDGYIVTNDHVIENANTITVLLYDGTALPAVVVGRDAGSDLAVIKIEQGNLPHLSFGDSSEIRVGQQVAAIGNPLGELANSMTVGNISALDRDVNIDGVVRNMMQTDAAINRGNSGGPLLNLHGQVIGVVSAKSVGMDVEGLGFAIPSNDAQEVVNQLVEYGFVRGRAVLGIQIGLQEGTGDVQIVAVNRGSAAFEAGLMPGDIILGINNQTIETFADLRAMLDELSPGDEVSIGVRRGNDEMTLTAVLDEHRPAGV